MRRILAALAMALVAVPVHAGGTSVKSSIVGQLQYCGSNSCSSAICVNSGASCSTNADCSACTVSAEHCSTNTDCSYSLVSPASKVQVSGTGDGKFVVKGVTGPGGVPVTTDGIEGTADDYILAVVYFSFYESDLPSVSLKLELKDGAGALSVDLSGVMPAAGTPAYPITAIFPPRPTPASCPGTNSPTDIAARVNVGACASGVPIAIGGIAPDTTPLTKLKSSIVPLAETCQAGACQSGTCAGLGISCSVNSDCDNCYLSQSLCTSNADCSYSLSPKSKFQASGAGLFKAKVKGMVDAHGAPINTDGVIGSPDDYIVALLYFPYSIGFVTKLDLKNGAGKVTADVSGVVPPVGQLYLPLAIVASPPAVPADCPGTNSAADIVSRGLTSGCTDGFVFGTGGVISGQ